MESIRSAPRRSSTTWIVSAPWDLAFLIATPFVILPSVLLLAQRCFTPEQISLVVVSFASIGHHLPGFMRAYGERELFRRYRWRFLLAPPGALLLTWTFASRNLHGLELILLFWATWHALMQTYGFMRIYDVKRGVSRRWDARLDWALCLAIFGMGFVFSDARVFGLIEVLWMAGVPLLDRAWLDGVRWLAASGAAVVCVLYAVHAVRMSRSLPGVAWVKILLALTTGFLYWICGAVSTNVLIGVAMFEIFHAIQYYAIVWSYERRLADRVGAGFGPLRFLFQDRWTLLMLYAAAIAAFGSIRFFGESATDPWVQQALLAALSASAMLHFYYDGFIWKVREANTQLGIGAADKPSQRAPFSSDLGLTHAAKWAIFALGACGLFLLETRRAPTGDFQKNQMLATLAAWTPELPELQFRLAKDAVSHGDTQTALKLAQHAVALRDESAVAHAGLGAALLQDQQYEAAAREMQRAVDLAPRHWRNHYELALACEQLGKWESAEQAFAMAARLEPGEAAVPQAWGAMLARRGEWEAALPHLRAALAAAPDSGENRYRLGVALAQLHLDDQAQTEFQEVIAVDPRHAQAHFQSGNLDYAAGKNRQAEAAFLACIRFSPEFADAYNNLGALLLDEGRFSAAETAFREALARKPDYAAAHYNLGLVLLNQEKLVEARREIQEAAGLGQKPTPEVAAALNP